MRFHSRAFNPVVREIYCVALVEAKLWSEKSRTGDNDQLVRYLRVLKDRGAANFQMSAQAARY